MLLELLFLLLLEKISMEELIVQLYFQEIFQEIKDLEQILLDFKIGKILFKQYKRKIFQEDYLDIFHLQ
jgi:hypothetical protein